MTNLLKETLGAITESGHTPADIVFIGSTKSGHSCTWEEFERLADFDYDSSYGAAYVPGDLVVVFKDGMDLHRGEYDGSEWWEFSQPFARPPVELPITTLQAGKALWPDLAELQPDQ